MTTNNENMEMIETVNSEVVEDVGTENGGNGAVIALGVGLVIAGAVAVKKLKPKVKAKLDAIKEKREAKKEEKSKEKDQEKYVEVELNDD